MAISFACFQGGGLPAIVIIAVVFFLVVLLAVWCAYSGVRVISLGRKLISRFWKRCIATISLPDFSISLKSSSALPLHVHPTQSSNGPGPGLSTPFPHPYAPFQASMHSTPSVHPDSTPFRPPTDIHSNAPSIPDPQQNREPRTHIASFLVASHR